jgi:hypothetical protein
MFVSERKPECRAFTIILRKEANKKLVLAQSHCNPIPLQMQPQ